MPRALRAWAIDRRGKNSVRNLQYGPQTRLVRNKYLFVLYVNYSLAAKIFYKSLAEGAQADSVTKLRKQTHLCDL